MLRIVLASAVILTGTLASSTESRANTRVMTRQEIRSMPLIQRPNRPGHIYGNTVRRLAR